VLVFGDVRVAGVADMEQKSREIVVFLWSSEQCSETSPDSSACVFFSVLDL